MCQASLLVLPLGLLMLIFTPHTQSNATFRRNDRASTHVDRLSYATDTELWTQLIAYTRCSHVVLLDSFELLANRPTFARQLFARLTAIGVRVSVRRQLRASERLPLATHRLAIIVPIVMKPSKVVTDELESLFEQIAEEPNFVEFYRWMFLFLSAREKNIWYALQKLPIRADSNVYCAIVGHGKALPFDHPIHLERKLMTLDRYVRRMQMTMVHPEVSNRTVASLTLPGLQTRPRLAVWQLYRLATRTKTIDVVVELVEATDTARIVLHQPLTPEQRNDFFDQTDLTIMVYGCRVRHINSTNVAQSMPLFRNARVRIETYKFRGSLTQTDFHFHLTLTKPLNNRLQGLFTYSLPVFNDHLSLYIHQGTVSYNERSSAMLIVILLPMSLLGTVLCLSLQLAQNVTNARRTDGRTVRPTISVADAFIWLVGVFAQQGSTIFPNSSSSMIVILVALYFSSIMYCTYLTEITSQLSVDIDEVHDLQMLLLAKEYRIGFVENFTTDRTFIGKRFDPVINEVMQRMQHDKSLYVLSHDDGLQRVLTSKYALIGSPEMVHLAMQKLPGKQSCIITEINLKGIEYLVALKIPYTNAYRKMINYEILRYYSNGINSRIGEAIIPRRSKCIKQKQFHRISTYSTTFQLLLFIAGAALAVVLLGVELLYYYFRKNTVKWVRIKK